MLLLASSAAAALLSSATAPRKFDAATFSGILDQRTRTSTTYHGLPLADYTNVGRSKVLKTITRIVDADAHPNAEFEDSTPGSRTDGRKRSQAQATYDWLRDGQRVLTKGAMLSWDINKEFWQLQFSNVKLALDENPAVFDELLLALYTPRGAYLYRHDLTTGVSTNGKSTAAVGHMINIFGQKHEENWSSALDDTLLPKLDESGCKRLAFVPFDDERFQAALADHPTSATAGAYVGVPLFDISARLRSQLLISTVREIDAALHPVAIIADPIAGTRIDGRKRGLHQAPYSWLRDGKRVACKSAQLKWDCGRRGWILYFSNVKLAYKGEPAAFDELLLTAYTPRGVYVFRYDLSGGQQLSFGVSTNGKLTPQTGHVVHFSGKSNERDWRVSFDETLLPKIEAAGWETVALIDWPKR